MIKEPGSGTDATGMIPSIAKIRSPKELSEGSGLPGIEARVRSSQANKSVGLPVMAETPLKLINWSIPPGFAAATLNRGQRFGGGSPRVALPTPLMANELGLV